MNYYNEFEPKAAAALKQLISDGLIPNGDVDDRSITDVRPEELKGYTQCHFFAGIGGWSLALQLAGWPADRPVWTGSCPCQPFSTAGKQKGTADERHLWPVWFNLIRECKPPIVFGEQVASAVSHGWLDGVYSDLEAEGYACGSAVLPACSVNAPHKRDRLWFVADATSIGGGKGWKNAAGGNEGSDDQKQPVTVSASNSSMADAKSQQNRRLFERNAQPNIRTGSTVAYCISEGSQRHRGYVEQHDQEGRKITSGHNPKIGFWNDCDWIICGDRKARRIPTAQSGIRLLAYGIPERVGLLRAGGNAIVPEVAARFIKAYM